MLAEQHLTSTAGYMRRAMNSTSLQDFNFNCSVAISHSTAATLLLYTALNNTHNIDSNHDSQVSMLQALKDYSDALGEHELNPNSTTRENYEASAENVRKIGLEFYRHVETLSGPMFIYYPDGADYTEGRVDYGSLIASTEKYSPNPQTLRILAVSYHALATLKPFVTFPQIDLIDVNRAKKDLKDAEAYNYVTQYLLYKARTKEMTRFASPN